MKKIIPQHQRHFRFDQPLTVTLLTFLTVVAMARLIGFLVITNRLPSSLFLDVRGFRLHHFVYGNIIIVILGFLKIVLGVKISPRISALIYAIGLGLVIDEFALWSGAITYLRPTTLQIFNGINIAAVLVVAAIISLTIYFRHRNNIK